MNGISASGQILSPKLATGLGTALIVVALALPFLASFGGYISPAAASYDAAKFPGLFLGLGLLIWLATRHRDKAVKAYAIVLTGLGLCLFSGCHPIQPNGETDAETRFVIASVAHHARQTAEFTELEGKFEKVDMSRILTPHTLSTREGLTEAQAGISNYRALVTERRVLMQTQLTESDRFINEHLSAGVAREIGALRMNEGRTALVKMYSDMDQADTRLLDAMSKLVDWGVAQDGRLGLHQGNFVFQNNAQKVELQQLVAAVLQADAARDAIVRATTLGQAKAEQRQDRNAAGVENFMKNESRTLNPASSPR
ncbi:MAG TPA: hypothetical protein VE934_13470 [Polaromonas sp.]|uniref:hypothetical protein n=1 Tax=Polaromonas sp. TaxID=1869339 RepID=UPI002D2B9B54|nr:hypothetical protein [Polaromonas sp.]HYW57969.1 hypothetical protein [Polaromonas sp.]